ncbi:MAG: hypothetical protein LBO63_00250 [Oscillospiraceae bacterium]|jgi:4-amino-4-deoxy-L-arabinose transferase-like glycosyltransferase|nr:hypothetical protein [Oscillospiraceae bacterium]
MRKKFWIVFGALLLTELFVLIFMSYKIGVSDSPLDREQWVLAVYCASLVFSATLLITSAIGIYGINKRLGSAELRLSEKQQKRLVRTRRVLFIVLVFVPIYIIFQIRATIFTIENIQFWIEHSDLLR